MKRDPIRNLYVSLIFVLLIATSLWTSSISAGDTRASSIPDTYYPGIIRVNATFPNGDPAVCYNVKVTPYGSTIVISSNFTDSSGFANMTVNFESLGYVNVHILNSSGKVVKRCDLFIGPDDLVELDVKVIDPMISEYEISGTVRDKFSNAPIGGMNVSIRLNQLNHRELVDFQKTFANGKFSFMVPYSIDPYQLIFTGHNDYFYRSLDVFLEEGENQVDLDVSIPPVYKPDIPFHIRFSDVGSGDPFTSGTIEISGNCEDLQHSSYMESTSTNKTVGGWFNTTLGTGDYGLMYYGFLDEFDININWNAYYYVNSTPVEEEFYFDLPGYVPVEIELWNESDPLYQFWVSQSSIVETDYGSLSIYCSNYTDTSGRTTIFVRDDQETKITYSTYFGSGYLYVDPTSDPGPYYYNITIEPPPTVPNGNIEILIKERSKNIPVPNALVNLYQRDDTGSFYSFYARSDMNGRISNSVRSGTYFKIRVQTGFGESIIENVEVIEGETTTLTIYIDRDPPIKDLNDVYFYAKDDEGNPVPNHLFSLYYQRGGRTTYIYPISDENGKVSFQCPSGNLRISVSGSSAYYRNDYATSYLGDIVVPEGGGQLEDIILYETGPLEKIWGFVLDKETQEPISGAFTATSSFRFLAESDEDFDPFGYIEYPHPKDPVNLAWTGCGSVRDGYYRMWGMEKAHIYCNKQGYFPKYDMIDMGTRAEYRHDFLLESIPDYDIFVNGTLVDQSEEPIEGYVHIIDLDHDMYFVEEADANETGKFSIPAYPGHFRIIFSNETLEDFIELEVGPVGVEDLVLRLVPKSNIFGSVVNWSGEAIPDMNVTLVKGDEDLGSVHTNESGSFSFEALEGTYMIKVGGDELYEGYISEEFTVDGWEDHEIQVELLNRSHGMMEGYVFGDGGPFLGEGIPEAWVRLFDGEEMLLETITNESGSFFFEEVPYGDNYTLNATPPEWLAHLEGVRPGYRPNSTMNLTLDAPLVMTELILPYQTMEEVAWLDVLEVSPTGEGVALDTPLMIVFSDPVNRTALEDGFSIQPYTAGIVYDYNYDENMVIIEHDNLEPNTTYEVTLAGWITSKTGTPMREYLPFVWDFTTGGSETEERIFAAEVEVTENKDVYVSVVARRDLDLYFVIEDLDSFWIGYVNAMIYEVNVSGDNLEWDTTYSYYFSDSVGGEDIAPAFAGEFITPPEPVIPVDWELYSAYVVVDDMKNWDVEVTGPQGLDIYMIIAGVGPYPLDESDPGVYTLFIDGTEFQWGATYEYHFTNSPGGEDLAPDLSGSVEMPEEEIDGGESEEEVSWVVGIFGVWGSICCFIVIILFLFIIVIVILVVVLSRRKKEYDFEE